MMGGKLEARFLNMRWSAAYGGGLPTPSFPSNSTNLEINCQESSKLLFRHLALSERLINYIH